MITRTEAIKNFLNAFTHPDLAALYNYGMEVQCNVAKDNGERISTEGYRGRTWHHYSDGIQQWYGFRIPKKADSDPEYSDIEIKFDLAEHAEGIGLTGWCWTDRVSKWVGFDFDSILNHSNNALTNLEIEEAKKAACNIPWVTVRRSTSGNGLHLYVFLDNISTENHTEHAALARAILGKMVAATGFDFSSKVDGCGGVLWIWHRKMLKQNKGLYLIKQGTILKVIPPNWRDHVPVIKGKRKKNLPKYIEDNNVTDFERMTEQRPVIKLDNQHKKLLNYLEENSAQFWWDSDHHMLVCHTFDLKNAHKKLKLRGIFDTISSGREQGSDHNAFCYPLPQPEGAWVIRRYTQGIQETSNWDQDINGWTRCYYNREPTLDIASRFKGGLEDEKGNFEFKEAPIEVAKSLGIILKLPKWALSRRTQLKQHKDGRLLIYIDRTPNDDPSDMPGWRPDKLWWKRIFNARLQQPSEPISLNFDNIIRHLVTPKGVDFGWVIQTSNGWNNESYINVRNVLKTHGMSESETIQALGNCVLEPWTLINDPFQNEFPGNRKWNRDAAQFAFIPKKDEPFIFPTWQRILDHGGRGLDSAIIENGWCQANDIKNGADYLKIWVASLFQNPKKRLPYLFFYSKEERTGKTTFHNAIGMLMTSGYTRADLALISGAGFNGELEHAVLCAIEEINLQKNPSARNRMKDWVTGTSISIHHKGKTPYDVENTVHFIQTGNDINECPIYPGDSRITMIHMPPFELSEMLTPDNLLAKLKNEAADFMGAILKIEIPPSNDRLNVPVIDTDIKFQTSQINRTSLEIFLDETTYDAPGETILYSELFNKFIEWLDPTEVHNWSKIKFGRELPVNYPKGRVMTKNAQFYVGNISFTKIKNTGKNRLILRGDKLC